MSTEGHPKQDEREGTVMARAGDTEQSGPQALGLHGATGVCVPDVTVHTSCVWEASGCVRLKLSPSQDSSRAPLQNRV